LVFSPKYLVRADAVLNYRTSHRPDRIWIKTELFFKDTSPWESCL
jgi:hypothetical protein